ncbi:uncharacterized protein KY384_003369 [Bacidia gigantensis]|uniref:uncharacterized protein n=1 Tax=Bacidia gigantensis TaxID=2732470 RepID=UPI001D0477A1|nr:uncharacterized protein KY384_003369 [Bacidia gigantensis]KAG8531737.1 hypothetical protein KY384_003369 [Bacidia gigantensis]
MSATLVLDILSSSPRAKAQGLRRQGHKLSQDERKARRKESRLRTKSRSNQGQHGDRVDNAQVSSSTSDISTKAERPQYLIGDIDGDDFLADLQPHRPAYTIFAKDDESPNERAITLADYHLEKRRTRQSKEAFPDEIFDFDAYLTNDDARNDLLPSSDNTDLALTTATATAIKASQGHSSEAMGIPDIVIDAPEALLRRGTDRTDDSERTNLAFDDLEVAEILANLPGMEQGTRDNARDKT